MKKLLALLLAGLMLFSLAACGDKGAEAPSEVGTSLTEDGEKSMVIHYGTNHYEEYEAIIYQPEGAYFDEDDYADYEEDGYMYTAWVYDDEREYSAHVEDYWSRASFNSEPIGYDVAQQLYFEGKLDEATAAEYTNCSQKVTPLGFKWQDKDVMLIETSYTDADEFDYTEIFVGVEYEILYWYVNESGETEENLTAPGLVGFELTSGGWEPLTEDQCAWVAGELFGVDSGRTWPLED